MQKIRLVDILGAILAFPFVVAGYFFESCKVAFRAGRTLYGFVNPPSKVE